MQLNNEEFWQFTNQASDRRGGLVLLRPVAWIWTALYSALYMDAALAQLRAEGFPVLDEDVARLSPLPFGHVNMLGRYAELQVTTNYSFLRGASHPKDVQGGPNPGHGAE